MINRNRLAALLAALPSVFSTTPLYADTIATPIDLSADVIESILPGGKVKTPALFSTTIDPKQSAELLQVSSTGVNGSTALDQPFGRIRISGPRASSLAESDGNGRRGVSQLIFGIPGGSGQNTIRTVDRAIFLDAHLAVQRTRSTGYAARHCAGVES